MNTLFSPFNEGWNIAVERRNLKHETKTIYIQVGCNLLIHKPLSFLEGYIYMFYGHVCMFIQVYLISIRCLSLLLSTVIFESMDCLGTWSSPVG